MVTIFMCFIYLILAGIWGNLGKITEVKWQTGFLLFISGIYGLSVGTGLGFMAIRIFGVMVHRIAQLSLPIIVGTLSYFILGETLSCTQMVFGAVLLTGCYLSIRKYFKKAAL
jgi:drug/metabolite transporter (DMT)-like permease